MDPFTTHRGKVALLDRGNIDTDQIIPKQFLKSIKKTGYGDNLFYDWRYLANGQDNPEFELNQERFKDASILVAGNNFGCGSSREHAVWAIMQYGLKVIIAPRVKSGDAVIPGFADIFRNNGYKNGLLTIELDEANADRIKECLKQNDQIEATVDLPNQTITLHTSAKTDELTLKFDIDPSVKKRLTQGLDDIGLTLEHEQALASFEKKHNPQMYG
jgi:3-isopropylmalate/(R)-2-methylmalate dehydratase small subunit